MGVKRQLSDSCCVGNNDNVLTADDLWKKRDCMSVLSCPNLSYILSQQAVPCVGESVPLALVSLIR